MPRSNQQRRNDIADAAIEIVRRDGLHGLSHRAVDEEAAVPRGTTSNYFRSRDALIGAAAQRTLMVLRRFVGAVPPTADAKAVVGFKAVSARSL